MRRLVFLEAFTVAASGFFFATTQGCASQSCEDTDTCASSGTDGGSDATGDHEGPGDARHDSHRDSSKDGTTDSPTDSPRGDSGGETGPTCTPGAAPADGGCITATSGVFVATSGMDMTGYGSMTMPYKSVSYALLHLGASNAVYVCNGSYTDQIPVTAAVSLYGDSHAREACGYTRRRLFP